MESGSIEDIKIPDGTELRIIITNDSRNEIDTHMIRFHLQTPTYRIFDKLHAVKRVASREFIRQEIAEGGLQRIIDAMIVEFDVTKLK